MCEWEGGGPSDAHCIADRHSPLPTPHKSIAEPRRVPELLSTWCEDSSAKHLVVTMKFKGSAGPDWSALAEARQVAENFGYSWRVKHFFNNKVSFRPGSIST